MSNAPEAMQAAAKPPASPAQSAALTASNFPALIHSLHADQATGLLHLEEGKLRKTVYVQDGDLVFARSSDPEDRLSELLLRKGILSIRGLEHYSDDVANAGQRLGAFLVERGLITPAEIIDGVREQVREIILSLFQWTGGVYVFRRDPLPPREVITLKMNTLELLREGIHRIQTWSRIREAVGGLEAIYQAVPDAAEALQLPVSDQEGSLLRFCASPVSVGRICDTLPGDKIELCRSLWVFHVMGGLKRQQTDAVAGDQGPEVHSGHSHNARSSSKA